jgi:hypothetical protein
MTDKKTVIELAGFGSDPSADHIANLWSSWDAGRKVWKDRVAEVVQYVFATSTRETSNAKNPWSHSTHIPKLTQIYDNLGANYYEALFNRPEFFKFRPGHADETDKKKAIAIEKYLTTKHQVSGFFKVMRQLTDDYRLYGNAFAQVCYVREYIEDREGNQVITYEGPRIKRISPYDIVFDHTASSFENSPKVVRSLVSRASLLDDAQAELGMEYDPEVLEKLKQFSTYIARQGASEINKNIQRRFDGFMMPSDYFRSGKVEVLKYYGDIFDPISGKHLRDRVVVVVDRRWVLANHPAGDINNVGQIYQTTWRDRVDNLWGMGPLENLVGMQYLIDHLENARADAFDQMLSPDMAIVGNVQIEEEGSQKVYYITDGNGSVTPIRPDATALNADFQIERKEMQMEVYAGAPREAMGFRTPGEKTKFEVQELMNAAARIFQHKIEKFDELTELLLNAEVEVAVKNLSAPDVIEVLDDDFGVIDFLEVTPEDLRARGKIRAVGAKHYQRQAQLAQELREFSGILAGDQEMAVHFPAQKRAEAWNELLGFEKFEMFVPFGAIAEQVELQQAMQAAQRVTEESQAAEEGLDQAQDEELGLA